MIVCTNLAGVYPIKANIGTYIVDIFAIDPEFKDTTYPDIQPNVRVKISDTLDVIIADRIVLDELLIK